VGGCHWEDWVEAVVRGEGVQGRGFGASFLRT